MNRPDVTIVVCTYNRAEMLRDAVRSLLRLDTTGFSCEVLVVDNASPDHTPQVIAELAAEAPFPVCGVRETRQGVPFARNRGVAEARGDWIAFFDDDQLADPHWLRTLLDFACEKRARCVGGAVHLHFPPDELARMSPVVRMLLGETVGRDQPCRYSPMFTPGTGNMMLHRSVFEEVGTFDEALVRRGEDTDLFMRVFAARIECWYTPAAIIHHVIPKERMTPKYLRRLATFVMEDVPAIDWNERGPMVVPLMAAARIAHAGMVSLPQYVLSRIIRNRHRELGALCRLQMAVTYAREAVRLCKSKRAERASARSQEVAPISSPQPRLERPVRVP